MRQAPETHLSMDTAGVNTEPRVMQSSDDQQVSNCHKELFANTEPDAQLSLETAGGNTAAPGYTEPVSEGACGRADLFPDTQLQSPEPNEDPARQHQARDHEPEIAVDFFGGVASKRV